MPTSITPITVSLKVKRYTDCVIAGLRELTLYVTGTEYKRLPLDANVREPNPSKSRPYKDMKQTLVNNPEKFFENNLGISIIATDVSVISKQSGEASIDLYFQHGTGILNGGHTQQAILDVQDEGVDLSTMLVRLCVRVSKYNEARIAEIAAAQNSSTSVKEYSLAEKRGLFASLKAQMSEEFSEHTVWYEGRQVGERGGLDPTDLIAYLMLFNVFAYSSKYSSVNTQPLECSNGKGKVFSRWEKSSGTQALVEFERIYPLADDILRLMEFINREFANFGSQMARLAIINETRNRAKPQIFSGKKPEYILPRQMLMPLLAAFRANVYYDATKNKIGWCCDNMDLMTKYNKELCNKLKVSYKAGGNEVNRLSKDPAIWENLFTTLRSHIEVEVSKAGFKPYKEFSI